MTRGSTAFLTICWVVFAIAVAGICFLFFGESGQQTHVPPPQKVTKPDPKPEEKSATTKPDPKPEEKSATTKPAAKPTPYNPWRGWSLVKQYSHGRVVGQWVPRFGSRYFQEGRTLYFMDAHSGREVRINGDWSIGPYIPEPEPALAAPPMVYAKD